MAASYRRVEPVKLPRLRLQAELLEVKASHSTPSDGRIICPEMPAIVDLPITSACFRLPLYEDVVQHSNTIALPHDRLHVTIAHDLESACIPM